MANIFIVTAKSCGKSYVEIDEFGYYKPTDDYYSISHYSDTIEYCASLDVAHDCIDEVVKYAVDGKHFTPLKKTKISDLFEWQMPYRENAAIVRQIVLEAHKDTYTWYYILEIERKRLKE